MVSALQTKRKRQRHSTTSSGSPSVKDSPIPVKTSSRSAECWSVSASFSTTASSSTKRGYKSCHRSWVGIRLWTRPYQPTHPKGSGGESGPFTLYHLSGLTHLGHGSIRQEGCRRYSYLQKGEQHNLANYIKGCSKHIGAAKFQFTQGCHYSSDCHFNSPWAVSLEQMFILVSLSIWWQHFQIEHQLKVRCIVDSTKWKTLSCLQDQS